MKKSFWITQSEPRASVLAGELSKSGRLVTKAPVMAIKPILQSAPAESADLVVCLSSHAARFYLESNLYGSNREVPHIAIGRTTASILRTQDISTTIPDIESSEGILKLRVLEELAPSQVVWVLAGCGGLGVIESALADTCRLIKVALYERVEKEIEGVVPETVGCIVISSEVGLNFVEKFWRANEGDFSTPILVVSNRVREKALDLGFSNIHNVESANTSDIFNYIQGFLDGE